MEVGEENRAAPAAAIGIKPQGRVDFAEDEVIVPVAGLVRAPLAVPALLEGARKAETGKLQDEVIECRACALEIGDDIAAFAGAVEEEVIRAIAAR